MGRRVGRPLCRRGCPEADRHLPHRTPRTHQRGPDEAHCRTRHSRPSERLRARRKVTVEMPERPHALVCLPSPTGYLLVDPGGDPAVAACRDLLWQGELPDEWPAPLEGVRLALEGDLA